MKQILGIAGGTACVLMLGIVIGSAVTGAAYRQAHREEAALAGVHALDYWIPVTDEGWTEIADRTRALHAEQNRLADEREH